MFNASIIGVAIGLILLYLLLSWLASGINELIEIFLHRRAKNLEAAILDLLGPALKNAFYDHPLIQSLYSQKRLPDTSTGEPIERKKSPSYIAKETFSSVVVSLIAKPYRELAACIGDHGKGAAVTITLGAGIGAFHPQGKNIRIGGEEFNVSGAESSPQGMVLTTQSLASTTPSGHTKGSLVHLVDDAKALPTAASVLDNLKELTADLPPGVASLRTWLISTEQTIEKIQSGVESWFNEKMDRISGWYKRKTQVFLLVIGLLIAIAVNADTLMVGRTLWNSANLRDSVSATAQQVVRSGKSLCEQSPGSATDQTSFQDQLSCLSAEVGQLKGLGLPLGWPTPTGLDIRHPSSLFRGLSGDPRTWAAKHYGGQLLEKLLGLLLTALAISFGAPFWFDLLGRAVNLRASGRPPDNKKQQ